jgi:hypothetical protein
LTIVPYTLIGEKPPACAPVALGDGEQVRDADEDDEDVAREHAEDVIRGHVGGERADQERRGKRE